MSARPAAAEYRSRYFGGNSLAREQTQTPRRVTSAA